jgi:hypothetical protein
MRTTLPLLTVIITPVCIRVIAAVVNTTRAEFKRVNLVALVLNFNVTDTKMSELA